VELVGDASYVRGQQSDDGKTWSGFMVVEADRS